VANLSQRSEYRTRPVSRRTLSRSRLVRSFQFAWYGVHYAWRQEPNFKLEVGFGVAACALAIWLGVSPVPILLASALVLGLELINSAVEATIDLVSPEAHPLAKTAKDAAAAAVLLASLVAVIIGLWHMGPALVSRLL
jgi:diacylglycerol kinase (ATP)